MKLTCDEITAFVDAYLDDEFDAQERAEFEAHIGSCESCRKHVELQLEFKRQFKKTMAAERAPEHLRENILVALQAEAGVAPRGANMRRYGMIAAPLAAALAAVLLLPALTIAPAASDTPPAIEQAVDWHQRDFPLEVRTQDPIEVSKWFKGKVDFPVRPPNFAAANGKLIGARLANVEDERAALVAYEVDGQTLNVLMFHGDAIEVPSDKITSVADHNVALMSSRGYGVALMHDANITYAITSELGEADLVDVMTRSLRR